jgi:isocitrate dehydrogenase kinase/phosphatase
VDSKELEQRVTELEEQIRQLSALARETADVREIQEVQYRYIDALMLTKWDECAECFSEDALVDVYLHEPVRGKENIRGSATVLIASRETGLCKLPEPPPPPARYAARRNR